MLQLVVLGVIVGITLIVVQSKSAKTFQELCEFTQDACMIVVGWAMAIAPIAVASLMIKAVTLLQSKFETVIPGHGKTTNVLGVHEFQRFLGQLTQIGLKAAADGISLEQTLASDQLNADKHFTPLRVMGFSLGLDREFVLRRAWQEATGNFETKNQHLGQNKQT